MLTKEKAFDALGALNNWHTFSGFGFSNQNGGMLTATLNSKNIIHRMYIAVFYDSINNKWSLYDKAEQNGTDWSARIECDAFSDFLETLKRFSIS